MEILKIIIECESCVFVLAIDYEVVSRGVRAKYGQDITENKVKNFFDKIIQVPFALPVSRYDLSNYIKELITAADLDNELKEIKTENGQISSDYIDMIRLSIGGNPRSIKRLLNTFRLLCQRRNFFDRKRRSEMTHIAGHTTAGISAGGTV
ncbi:hypothetical protein SDC9_120264 [bioreactor metagenome]|uniref:KAP NTPase domain-containing protein n=1 Tax=bioreactor metagenome TaxID=1076179 RepID=A0A645C7T2_9ZZZZ